MSDLFVTHQGGRILPPQEEANVLSPREREEMLAGGAICPNCGDKGCPHCGPAKEGDEYRPPEVRDLTLVGGCYSMGRYLSGWGVITLVGGERVRISETDNTPPKEGEPCRLGGMDGLLRWAESKGYDTTRMRERVAEWVRTGTMPPHIEVPRIGGGSGTYTTTTRG